jgi:hypothetical protein
MNNRDPLNKWNQSPNMKNSKIESEADDNLSNRVTDFAGRMKDQAGDAAESRRKFREGKEVDGRHAATRSVDTS